MFVSGIFVLLFIGVGLTLLISSLAATSLSSVKSGNWNDPTVWGGRVPGTGDTPIIQNGHTVTFNVASSRVGGARVNAGGTLRFNPSQSATLESTENIIVNGVLEMKPSSAAAKQTLRFVGVNEAGFVGGGMDPLATDVGLWVMGAGKLNITGTQKSGWLHAAGGIAAGTSTFGLEKAPTGWAAGDEISVSPTGAPNTGGFSTGFDVRTLGSVSGSNITLNSGVGSAHPQVNGRWTAEVMNLTRNVVIEGTANGRTHIFIRSSQPQVIKHAMVRHFGPRQAADEYTEFVPGRYGLHFHHSMEGSRGSLVDGTVLRDGGSHAYVPHMSHGVTFRDTVSYNTFEDAYWWDPGPDTRTAGPETHDTLFDHAIAAIVKSDPDFRGYRLAGFQLLQGNRNEIRDSVAVGVQGTVDASGFSWAESFGPTSDNGQEGHGEWNFARDNIGHNNAVDGLFAWQNDGQPHVIANFAAYHNGEFGIEHGAYLNNYLYEKLNLYGNGKGGVKNIAGTTANTNQQTFRDVVINGAGISDHLIEVAHHTLESEGPIHYDNAVLTNAKKQPIFVRRETNTQAHVSVEFLNSSYNGTPLASMAHGSLFRWDGTMINSIFARVMNGASAYRVANPATNEVPTRTSIAAFADTVGDVWTPQPSINYPSGGDTVNGTVSVSGFAHDDSGMAKVDFLVDGAVKGSDAAEPFAFSWNTAGLSGAHTIQLRGTDKAGRVGVSPITTVFVGTGPTTPPPAPEPPAPTPDTTAPTVSVTAPASNASVSGNVSVTATAADAMGITKVEFYVDGSLRGTDTSPPYSYALNTAGLSNGQHTITARASDAAGNIRTSGAITISVNNVTVPPPQTFAPEDINQDGLINLLDFSLLSTKFGQTGSGLGRADINGDGKVNLLDFSRLSAKF